MTNLPHVQPKVRMDCIQILRAVAAIAVVTHHIPLFENGAWGVDLFFVISGFIMCYVTEDSGKRFLTKRIIRVVPLYWAGTLGIFGVALVMPHLLDSTTANLVYLVKSLAFIPFQKGNDICPMLYLGWTINYEMFFYLLFAISMAASHRYRAIICSTLILVIVVSGYLVPLKVVPYKFFTSSIILEFVFGMLCYMLFMRMAIYRPQHRPITSRILWILLSGALIAYMPLNSVLSPIGIRVIEWGIPAALSFYFIVYGLSGAKLPRCLVLIGDASYSLYLFHPYVINIFDKILKPFSGHGFQAYFMACVAIFLCCGLSVISYRYIEKPLTELLRKRFVL